LSSIAGYEHGSFLHPAVLRGVMPGGEVFQTEIIGPVLALMPVDTAEEAIEPVNAVCNSRIARTFTSDGSAARVFRNGVEAGMSV